MKGNDLDNLVVPRDVVVWEGLMASLPEDKKIHRLHDKLLAREKWGEAVSLYEVNEMMARKVWDLVWRYSMELDLLTYVGYGFAEALEKRIENENLPFRRVWHEMPNMLARRLAVAPDIRTIYDPNPAHRFTYGSKGRVLDPSMYNMLGAM